MKSFIKTASLIILFLTLSMVAISIDRCCDDQRTSVISQGTDGPLMKEAERMALSK